MLKTIISGDISIKYVYVKNEGDYSGSHIIRNRKVKDREMFPFIFRKT